jgi:hypothetical protein
MVWIDISFFNGRAYCSDSAAKKMVPSYTTFCGRMRLLPPGSRNQPGRRSESPLEMGFVAFSSPILKEILKFMNNLRPILGIYLISLHIPDKYDFRR